MQVHFIHPGHSYLPELEAYAAHLRPWGMRPARTKMPARCPQMRASFGGCAAGCTQRTTSALPRPFRCMNMPQPPSPFAWAKDQIKRWTQPKPDYRLFQNEWVWQRLGFADDVPWEFREMGVSSTF